MTKINRFKVFIPRRCCLISTCITLLLASCSVLRNSNPPVHEARAYHLRVELLPGSDEGCLYAALGATPVVNVMPKLINPVGLYLGPEQYSFDIRLKDDTQLQHLLTGLQSDGIRVESIERNTPN